LGNLYSFSKNSRAVSGVMGTLLLTCLVVILLSSLAGILLKAEPAWHSQVKLEEWGNSSSGTLYLRHSGGESLSIEELYILVYIHGERYEYSPANISAKLDGKKVWEFADVLELNPGQEWGFPLSDNESLRVVLVNNKEKAVLSQLRLTPENKSASLL